MPVCHGTWITTDPHLSSARGADPDGYRIRRISCRGTSSPCAGAGGGRCRESQYHAESFYRTGAKRALYTQRTNGRYITGSGTHLPSAGGTGPECTQSYLSNIRRLGLREEQALALAQKIIEEGTL